MSCKGNNGRNACITRNQQIYQLWMAIQDIIGSASLWAHNIRRLFWTPNLKHFERIIVCTFVFINGLNPEIFLEWALLLNLGRDPSAHRWYQVKSSPFWSTRQRLFAKSVKTSSGRSSRPYFAWTTLMEDNKNEISGI